MPSPAGLISSPYDVEARYSTKREVQWVGYKAHLTETCDEDRPHLGDGADLRDVVVNLVVAQMRDRIDVIDLNFRLVIAQITNDRRRFNERDHLSGILRIDAVLENMPGDSTIHGARVHVGKTETPGEFARHTAFARRSWTVDGNDPLVFRCHAKLKWMAQTGRAGGVTLRRCGRRKAIRSPECWTAFFSG